METKAFFREGQTSPTRRMHGDVHEPDLIQSMVAARKRLNLTQKELAARTGISQGDISKIETGATNPSIKVIQRLAAGLEMRLKLETFPQ